MNFKSVTSSLGYCGLIPIVAGVVLTWWNFETSFFDGPTLFVGYSALILCFLAGAIWGRVLSGVSSRRGSLMLIGSNAIVIIAWLALLISSEFFALGILILSLGYVAILVGEFRFAKRLMSGVTLDYLQLRFTLTILICLGHVGIIIAYV